MSGIAGIIRFDGAPVEPGLVEKMTAAMPYRGPDGINHWVKGSVALGHCMLRTTPESLEEHQPLTNEEESLVLVMDGRVDNWEELRRDLLGRGAVLRTRADAELVLRAYETWGRDYLVHIDGDFALVIWDARLREAFCVRDRVGNKPFNYSWDGKTFIFASELHAILRLPGVREVLNEGLLAEFLANEWYSRDETFWKGVTRLVAAHRMTVDAAGVRIEKYWEPDLWATLPCNSDDDYVEYYRNLLSDVVRRLSRSHHTLAFEVSGGLDSSALFALAKRLRHQKKLPAPRIRGYTLDFHGDPDANELDYSRAVSQYLKVPIYEIPAVQMSVEWYRKWAQHYREFPGFPNGIMAIGLRNASCKAGCRAIMSGAGGDEWLDMLVPGAYYAEELASRQWRNVYTCLKTDYRELGMQEALWSLFRYGLMRLLVPEYLKALLRKVRGKKGLDSLLSVELQLNIRRQRAQAHKLFIDMVKRRGQKTQIHVLYGAHGTLIREFEERLCSMLGLELRVPFWNEKIIQFSFLTPERLRSRAFTSKWLHRQSLKGLLPPLVLDRASKASFGITLRRNLRSMGVDLFSDIALRRAAWVQSEQAKEIYSKFHDAAFHDVASYRWMQWWLWSLIGCDLLTSD